MSAKNEMVDRHVRRSGKDYATALSLLLPTGLAWPREPNTVLMRAVDGLAEIFGFIDGRAADLLEIETDPRLTLTMLEDWERNWGLPDPCFPDAVTISERRNMLVAKMTMFGGQSREFFIALAEWLGYKVTITEFAPFMIGVSRFGDTRASADLLDKAFFYRWQIGAPEMRFYWVVHLENAAFVWFRCGAGQFGVDHHLNITFATNLECLFRRLKPAHTEVIFDYAGLSWPEDSLAGTP